MPKAIEIQAKLPIRKGAGGFWGPVAQILGICLLKGEVYLL
jgi:hypothetical protein